MSIPDYTRRPLLMRVSHLSGWLLVLASIGVVIEFGATSAQDPPEPDRPLAQIARYEVGGQVWKLARSPTDGRLAFSTIEGHLWLDDLSTGCALRGAQGSLGSAQSLRFTPDGRVLAVVGWETVVRLNNAESGAHQAGLDVGNRARSIAFSPEGALFAVGHFDGGVSHWNQAGRRRLASVTAHRGGVNALAFSPDSARLATGGSDGKVILWDTSRGQSLRILEVGEFSAPVVSLKFSPDGQLLASAGCHVADVRLWDPDTGEPRGTLSTSSHFVNAIAFSPDSTRLAVAQTDGTAIRDVARNQELASIRVRGKGILSVAFSGDGRILATGGSAGFLRLWDVTQILGGDREVRHCSRTASGLCRVGDTYRVVGQ